MPLPQLSHLQFLVVGIVMGAKKSGREVRAEMAKQRVKKSGPAFYQLMSRLEDAKMVKGSYVEKVVDGQRIKERFYKATGTGATAWESTMQFYIESASDGGRRAQA